MVCLGFCAGMYQQCTCDCLFNYSIILIFHHWMVILDRMLHCCDFENLSSAKYFTNSKFPKFGVWELFHKIQIFLQSSRRLNFFKIWVLRNILQSPNFLHLVDFSTFLITVLGMARPLLSYFYKTRCHISCYFYDTGKYLLID